MIVLCIINTILLMTLIILQLTDVYLNLKKTSKTEEIAYSEPTHPTNDIEELMIKAEDAAEAAEALKKAEEALELNAYGMNTALSNTISEIMEGKVTK